MTHATPIHSLSRWVPLRVALVYALIGGLWIVFSDRLVSNLFHDPTALSHAQTYKGWFYVAITALGLYLFLLSYTQRIQQSQRALRRSETQLRALLNAVPDLIFRINGEGVFLDYKPSKPSTAVPLIMPAEQFLGRTVQEVLSPDQVDETLATVQQAIRTGEVQLREYALGMGGEQHTFEARYAPCGPDEVIILVRDITARKQMEGELRRAHDELEQRVAERTRELAAERTLLRTLIDTLPDYVYIKDLYSRFVTVNAAQARILGLATPEDAVGRIDADFFPAELAARYLADEQKLFRTAQPLINHEEPVAAQSGEALWVLTTKVPLRDGQGQVIGLVGIGRDITARKQMEDDLRRARDELEQRVTERTAELTQANRQLQESERRLFTLMSNLPGMVYRCRNDRDWTMEFVSEGCLALTGYAAEDLVNNRALSFNDLIHPEDRQQVWDNIQMALAGHAPYQLTYRIVTAGGIQKWVWEQGQGVFAADGGVIALEGLIIDITARREAESALRESEERFRSAFEHAATGVAMVDLRGHFIRVNRALCEMLGYTRQELQALSFEDVTHPDDVSISQDQFRRALSGDIPRIRFEKRYQHKQGRTVWAIVSASLVRDARGKLLHFITQIQDITERKQAEEALRKANRAYRALSDCNQAMVRAADEATLLADIPRIIVERGGYRMAWVGFAQDDPEQTVQPVAFAGHEDGYLGEIHLSWGDNPWGQGPTGTAIRTGQPVVVQDIASDPLFAPWRADALRRGFRGCLVLPLIAGEQTLGTISVYAAEQDAFSAEEIVLLAELAGDLAFGLMTLRAQVERQQAQEQLRQSQANLLALTEHSREMIWSLDAEHRLIAFNSAFRRTVQEARGVEVQAGHSIYEFFPPDQHDRWRTFYQRALDGEQFITEERYVVASVPHDMEVALTPIRLEDGTIVGVSVFSHDISERKQAEAARQQLMSRLARRNRELLALYEVGRTLTTTFDLDQIYRVMCAAVGQYLLDAPHFILTLFDETTQMITCAYAVIDGKEEDQANFPPLPFGSGHFSETIRTRQPRIVDLDEYFREHPDRLKLVGEQPGVPRSGLYVPLISQDRVIGVFNVQHYEPGAFDDVDLTLLSTLANQAAIAIQNARLFAAERDQRTLAEALADTAAALTSTLDIDEVLDHVLDNVGRVVPHDAANIMLVEDDRVRIARNQGYAARGLGEWITSLDFRLESTPNLSHIVHARQPLCIPDTADYAGWLDIPEARWIRSWVGAPVLFEGQVLGLLSLDSATPGFFTQDQAEQLQVFANQAAIAIQNARLFAAERDQRTLAEALADTAAALNSTLDADKVLDHVLDNVGRVVPHDAANIMLIENGVARVARERGYEQHGLGEWIKGLRYVVADIPLWRRLSASRQPFAVPYTDQDPDWIELGMPQEQWIKSTIKAPIYLGDELIGILHLDSATPGAFSQRDADRLAVFAEQAATAIHNAWLFNEMQHYATEQQQRVAERTAELESQRAQLQTILDHMGEGVSYTVGQKIEYVNRAFVRLFGYSAEELAENPSGVFQRIWSAEEAAPALMENVRQAFARDEVWRAEARLCRRDGTTFDAAMTISQVSPSGPGNLGDVVALFRDISEQKALQAQRERFIANASHELRTPLANMKTRLYLIRRQPEKLDQHLDILERVTANMTEMVENMLDLSRLERGVIPLTRWALTLQPVLGEVAAIQQPEAERKNIQLNLDLPPTPVLVLGDRQRLGQVITNLVTNAINYTPAGGRVRLELTTAPGDEHAPDGWAVVRVRDTGIGIPPDALDQVFEPFFRVNETAAAGSGLGLTISREIVIQHQGTIHVESTVHQGTVFTIRLPILADMPAAAP